MPSGRLTKTRIVAWLRRFALEQDGTTATEYAVMLALILMGAIGVLQAFGGRITGMYTDIDGAVAAAEAGLEP